MVQKQTDSTMEKAGRLSSQVDTPIAQGVSCQPEMTENEVEMDIGNVLSAVADGGHAEGLRAVMVLRRLTDRLEAERVVRARRAGWTWAQIGDSLGVSRQAVHKKYKKAL